MCNFCEGTKNNRPVYCDECDELMDYCTCDED